MRRPAGFLRLLVAVLALAPLVALAALAAAPKGGRSGPARGCYDCHEKSRKEFLGRKVVHAPVKKGECAPCHRSHGFSQRLVLTKPAETLCLDCHSDALKAPAQPHRHPAFAKGDCLACHDPHATNRPHLVRDNEPESACLDCHDAIIFGSQGRAVTALDPSTGEEKWKLTTRSRVDSSPVIVGERVVAATSAGKLYLLDVKGGAVIWETDLGGGFSGSPAVVDGKLIIANTDGTLYCFGSKSENAKK